MPTGSDRLYRTWRSRPAIHHLEGKTAENALQVKTLSASSKETRACSQKSGRKGVLFDTMINRHKESSLLFSSSIPFASFFFWVNGHCTSIRLTVCRLSLRHTIFWRSHDNGWALMFRRLRIRKLKTVVNSKKRIFRINRIFEMNWL